jgi:hypothetical protein
MLTREPATGWTRFVGWGVLLAIVLMTVAAFSALDHGVGPAPTPGQRVAAIAIILLAGGAAIGAAAIAWYQSRRR